LVVVAWETIGSSRAHIHPLAFIAIMAISSQSSTYYDIVHRLETIKSLCLQNINIFPHIHSTHVSHFNISSSSLLYLMCRIVWTTSGCWLCVFVNRNIIALQKLWLHYDVCVIESHWTSQTSSERLIKVDYNIWIRYFGQKTATECHLYVKGSFEAKKRNTNEKVLVKDWLWTYLDVILWVCHCTNGIFPRCSLSKCQTVRSTMNLEYRTRWADTRNRVDVGTS